MGFALLLAAVLFLLAHCGQRKTPSEDSAGQNQQSEQKLTGQVNPTKESGPEKDVSSAEEPADEFSREEFLELGAEGRLAIVGIDYGHLPHGGRKGGRHPAGAFSISVQSFGEMMQK